MPNADSSSSGLFTTGILSTVRGRLTGVAFLAMLVVLAVGATIFLVVVKRSLVDEIDRSIINRAIDVSIEIDFTDTLDNTSFPTDAETFVGIVEDPSGEPLLEVHNDDRPDVAAVLAVYESAGFEAPLNASLDSITFTEGSDNLRIVFAEVETGDEVVVVARSLDGVDQTLGDIRNVVLLVVPALTLLVTGLVYVLAGRALQPVERIRSEVESISAGDLSRRVPVDGPLETDHQRNEFGRLATTMNDMLERLEQSQAAQRRFSSDAAHELRTPLASMRAQLDVGLAHPAQADWPTTAGRVHRDVERMQRLVDDLLTLARADGESPALPESNHLVDLDDVVLTEVSSLVKPPGVEVDASGVSAASVRGNSDDLRRVAANLLANAVRHAESTVTVSVFETGLGTESGTGFGSGLEGARQSVLQVDDDGDGVPKADRERVFERFVRLDTARNRDLGGSGLGLALSREIAAAHGGTLHVESGANGGARFVLRLPVAGAAGAAGALGAANQT